MRAFGKLSLTQKMMAVIFLCLASTVVVAAVGATKMNRVGAEIEAIAHQDMPLAQSISRVTVLQLEQAVLLERVLGRARAPSEHDPA